MHLSDEDEREERADRDRLQAIESKLDALETRRRGVIDQIRKISAEQQALYAQRQQIQADVEARYDHQGELGHQLAALRAQREAARHAAEASVIKRRELLLTFPSTDRLKPEQIRREIAALELRQQTRALSLEDENALIKQLRQRATELKAAEAQGAVVAEHARQRKEADDAVMAARTAVARISAEVEAARAARDQAMSDIRGLLETAGGIVAEMRTKGKARAELIAQVDAVERDMVALEREGREVFNRTRSRRAEAQRLMRAFARPRERPPADIVATAADRRLEELMKRGKVTLA
jgi:uncharacterized coiled-coil DUF342 family protein